MFSVLCFGNGCRRVFGWDAFWILARLKNWKERKTPWWQLNFLFGTFGSVKSREVFYLERVNSQFVLLIRIFSNFHNGPVLQQFASVDRNSLVVNVYAIATALKPLEKQNKIKFQLKTTGQQTVPKESRLSPRTTFNCLTEGWRIEYPALEREDLSAFFLDQTFLIICALKDWLLGKI